MGISSRSTCFIIIFLFLFLIVYPASAETINIKDVGLYEINYNNFYIINLSLNKTIQIIINVRDHDYMIFGKILDQNHTKIYDYIESRGTLSGGVNDIKPGNLYFVEGKGLIILADSLSSPSHFNKGHHLIALKYIYYFKSKKNIDKIRVISSNGSLEWVRCYAVVLYNENYTLYKELPAIKNLDYLYVFNVTAQPFLWLVVDFKLNSNSLITIEPIFKNENNKIIEKIYLFIYDNIFILILILIVLITFIVWRRTQR